MYVINITVIPSFIALKHPVTDNFFVVIFNLKCTNLVLNFRFKLLFQIHSVI